MFGIAKLHHAYSSLSAIEAIEEFALHFTLTVNALECKVSIPIKYIPLKGLNKLFDTLVTLYTCIVASFDEIVNMLLQISLSIKYIELWVYHLK